MSWYLDFIGFQFPHIGFVIKEIAILHSDGDRCYNYFITGPKYFKIDDYMTYNYQFDLHNLRWGWGDYEFSEAMQDIAHKIQYGTIYIKGHEKYKFISALFPMVTFIELENIPAFKHLNNYIHERCDVKHGNHCARRRVYELMHAVNESFKRKDEVISVFSN
jgi:hypothetical protein